MPLHIIKMTMIVIFVPSPPHLLLFSRVPLALPVSVFSSPTRCCVPGHRHLHTSSIRGPCGREKERSFSLSLPPSSGDGETRRDREDSEIPSRPVYSLLSLGPAHRRARARESLGLLLRPSQRVTLPRTVSYSLVPSPSVQRFPSIRLKVSRRSLSSSCRVFQRVQRKAHRRAPLLVDRGPRTCISRIQTATIIVTFVGDDAQNDRPLRTTETNRPRAFADLADHVHSICPSLCTCVTRL